MKKVTIDKLSEAEAYLYGHYSFKYPDKFNEIYTKIFNNNCSIVPKLGQVDCWRKTQREVLAEIIPIVQEMAKKENIPQCPICGLRLAFMSKHVKHCHKEITWPEFIEKYNWTYGKLYYTDAHRDNLSKNKLHYYNETKEGLKAREELKIKYAGDKNPAHRLDVRLKISKARFGYRAPKDLREKCSINCANRMIRGDIKFPSFGYRINVLLPNGKDQLLRSKTEFTIYLLLKHFNIMNFEFEPFRIEYFDLDKGFKRQYILDLKVGNRLFEIKAAEKYFDNDPKYKYINDTLSKINKKLECLTPMSFAKLFNVDYGEYLTLDIDRLIIDELLNGNCSIKLPINQTHFFLEKYLGKNWKTILEEKNLEYENKINKRS